jgi:hypothetical protein
LKLRRRRRGKKKGRHFNHIQVFPKGHPCIFFIILLLYLFYRILDNFMLFKPTKKGRTKEGVGGRCEGNV